MTTIYDQISSNKRETIVIMFAFVIVVTLLAFFFGEVFVGEGAGYPIMIFAVLFSSVSSVSSYYFSDKIALKITLSEDLLLEGDFRALIRKIQQARKVNNLNVGDKIDLQYTLDQEKIINTFKVEIVKITNVVDFIKSDVFNVIKR